MRMRKKITVKHVEAQLILLCVIIKKKHLYTSDISNSMTYFLEEFED